MTHLFCNSDYRAVCYSGFAASITEFTIVEMLPQYLKQVQGYDLLASGFMSSLPFLVNLIVVFICCIGIGIHWCTVILV